MKRGFDLFLYTKEVIEGKRGLFAFLYRTFLHFCSFFYRSGASFRLLQKPQKVRQPVISVGSIKAGGTGKTPTLLFLLSFFKEQKCAVLSRGYLGEAEKKGLYACFGKGPVYSAAIMGDEPYLIAKKFPKVHVLVGRNRLKNALLTKQDLLFLDDGMQHRKLCKDFEIVILKKGFRGGHFLPRGFLRESLHALSRADLILSDGGDEKDALFLKKYSGAPIVGLRRKLLAIKNLKGEVKNPEGALCGAFCAIAEPESFFSLAKEYFPIEKTLILRDHSDLSSKLLHKFYESLEEKGFLLCTEKDAVKIDPSISLPIYYAEMDFEISFGKEHFDLLVEKIRASVK